MELRDAIRQIGTWQAAMAVTDHRSLRIVALDASAAATDFRDSAAWRVIARHTKEHVAAYLGGSGIYV